MIKKIVLPFLLAVVVLCGIVFSATTTAYATESNATEEASATSNLKVATVNLAEKYPSGYAENTSFDFMEGENKIGTLTIDKASSRSEISRELRVAKNSVFSFVPNADYNVKKLIYALPSLSSTTVFSTPDSKYGVAFDDPSDEDVALLAQAGVDANKSASFGVELNSNYEATEDAPYEFSFFAEAAFGSVCLIYEETGNYTRTYDCTNDKKGSPATVKVGDATFLIKYEGMFNNGYPAYGNGSFKITINPVPGYVINYVIFTSSIDNPFEASELRFPELEATYENGNLKVTGMQPGQTYELSSDGGAVGLLTSITVNYQKHEHSGVYEPGSDETHHFKQCECLWRVDEEEHTFDEGTITVEPTHQRKGTIKYTCTNAECGYEKEEQVAPNFADTEVSLDKELRYNGSIQFAVYTVKYKGYEVGMSNYKVVSGVARGKEPGDYTFTIGPKPDSIFEGEKEVTFTIKKGSAVKPAPDTTAFYYNGEVQTYTVEGSEHYTVLDNSNQQTNPGSYKVKIALSNPDYYEWEDGTTDTLEYDFVINKGNYDMEKVVFNDLEVTYDGEEHSITATNLPDGVTVEYENNVGTNAGTYNAIAKFTGNLDYYNPIANKTATLTINKAVVNAPTADTTVFTYNGQAQTYALQTNSLYSISTTTFTDADTYPITVALLNKTNYKWDNGNSDDLTYSFVINKATYDMSGVVFADKTVTYDGNAFSIEATNLPSGVTASYENNGKTNAGVYVVTATFAGNANYNEIPNKTATLTINKATYDMSGVVFADKTVTYNGTAFSIEATNLPTGVTVAYENNGKTDAGIYTITAIFTGNANYNALANKTATLTINKAVVTAPNADTTVFTYNGQAQTYALQTNNLYTISTATYTNAGAYPITVELNDKANYEWADGTIADLTFSFVIGKATYDMSGVVFTDKTVVYNGTAFSIEATNLPTGVTVAYDNNGKTDAGIYTITAIFTGNENYNAIDNKTATLTINKDSLTFNTDTENQISEDVVISSPVGINPTNVLVVEQVKETHNYAEFINKNQKVAFAYDIKLLKDGASVQPNGTLQFKILIPEELRDKDFSIVHIHNGNETSVIDYQIVGDYAVFESDKLSDFVFVYEMGSLLWLIILLAVIALLEVAFLAFLFLRKKNAKSNKLASVYPPFVFGMFLTKWQIVLAIILAVVVVALTVVTIIFAIKTFGKKGKALESEVQLLEENKNEDKEKRPVKSFSERLNQASPEINDYYSAIKGELSSFKGIKSKVSFKHESFRLGREIVARLKIRGKSLYLYLALYPKDYMDTKYKIKDMSAVGNCKDVPTMYKINLPRRVTYAKELIRDLMKKFEN